MLLPGLQVVIICCRGCTVVSCVSRNVCKHNILNGFKIDFTLLRAGKIGTAPLRFKFIKVTDPTIAHNLHINDRYFVSPPSQLNTKVLKPHIPEEQVEVLRYLHQRELLNCPCELLSCNYSFCSVSVSVSENLKHVGYIHTGYFVMTINSTFKSALQ